jgi:YVTN family beta-propeller protein
MAELPTGTVTFLFTDIEGSTRLLRQLRDDYAAVLADHARLLREVFARHGGTVVDTQGDSFFVAFPRARAATAAAVEAQRALAAHSWPEGVPVRVRMGLHSGEAVVEQDRYVGFVVHRAARIGSAGHGGQILISNATRELVEDDLPADVRCRDLGEHRLKDIDRPERLFQLEIEDLPAEFPPLKTLEPPPTPPARRKKAVFAGAGIAAAAGVAIGLVIVLGHSGTAKAIASVRANAIGVIDPDRSRIDSEISVGAAPGRIAAGDGALWVTNTDDQTVSRIDLDSNTVRQTIRVGGGPSAVAVGAGAVWAANGLGGSVSRIDPKTNESVLTISVGNAPAGLAVTGDAVWVANSNDGSLSRISPKTNEVVATLDAGGGANAVAYGFGSVWVANGTTARVSRIDPGTNEIVQAINVGNAPGALAVGAGAVWVANSADGTVSRIDPGTNAVMAAIAVGGGPSAVAATEDAVWVTDELEGRLLRIEPKTNEVVRTLRVGNRPEGVAVAGDSVYVSVRADERAHRGGTLRVVVEHFDSIDPALAFSFGSWSALLSTNSGLTAFKRVGGAAGTQLVPNLAVSLPTPADGGRSFTFRLRRGLRYSTGAPVKASDVRFAIERSLRIAGTKDAPAGLFLSGIVGAKECLGQPRRCDLARGIVTDDAAGTVTFHLVTPDPELPYKLALPFAYVLPAGLTEPKAGSGFPATGPYVVAESSKRGLRLVRNPRFREWSRAAQPNGVPDTIVWQFGVKAAAGVRAVEQGRADVTFEGVPADLLSEVAARDASQLHVNSSRTMHYLFLNTRLPPFDDVRVRKAVNYAVDRNELVRLYGGPEQAQITCQILPPNLPGYRPYCPYTVEPNRLGTWTGPDLARARRLIAASGTYGMSMSLWRTEIIAGPAGPYMAALLRSLGYRVKQTIVKDVPEYFSKMGKPRFRVNAGLSGYASDYTSAFNFVDLQLTCHAITPEAPVNLNSGFFCDRAVDRKIRQALELQTTDPQAATELWAEVDRALVDRAPWLPIVNLKTIDFVSARVGNYQYNPQWLVLLDQLWVR